MARNICTKEDKFFKSIFKQLRKEGAIDFKEEFGGSIRKKNWEKTLSRYIYDVVHVAENFDMPNINVDFENVDDRRDWKKEYEYTDKEFLDMTRNGLMGLHSLDSGALFFAFHCGGDWECPVNGILYVEDNVPKIYFPEKGNIFNPKYMSAYGNNRDTSKYKGKMCDQGEELKDIADFFENRKEYEHADGSSFYHPENEQRIFGDFFN